MTPLEKTLWYFAGFASCFMLIMLLAYYPNLRHKLERFWQNLTKDFGEPKVPTGHEQYEQPKLKTKKI